MAKTKISEFSATANSNTDINSINIAEGCAPSNINDAIRELMAELKDFQAGTKGDSFNGPVGTTTAAAGAFTTLSSTGNTTLGDASGDTVTINGTTTFVNVNPTLSAGTANGVLYLNGSKVATSGSALTFDGNTLTATNTSGNAIIASRGGKDLRFSGNYAGANTHAVISTTTGMALAFMDESSEFMRLTSTGLGIGTSSPGEKLAVNGSIGLQRSGTQYWHYGVNASNDLVFTRSQIADRLTLSSDGNLGLGVTPSAWGSTYKAFQAGTTNVVSGIASQTDNFVFHNFANAFYDGTNWKYIASQEAGRYELARNVHKWFNAPSGTAGNAITFTQAMTLDASGNLFLGATNSAAGKAVIKDNSSGNNLWLIGRSSDGTSSISFRNNADSAYNARIECFDTGVMTFGTGTSATERARIDSSGNMLVGTTNLAIYSYSSATGCNLNANGTVGLSSSGTTLFVNRTTSDGAVTGFYRAGNQVGTISVTTSATAYNTSSDYRLKENIQPMIGALAKVQALKPCTYNWKADGSAGEGFIAHELAEVVPQCVTGAKDAVDEDGNPVYQGIDTSFLVATLTAALQEAHGLIKDLQARVEALEAK